MPFMTAPFLGQAGLAPCVADFPVRCSKINPVVVCGENGASACGWVNMCEAECGCGHMYVCIIHMCIFECNRIIQRFCMKRYSQQQTLTNFGARKR